MAKAWEPPEAWARYVRDYWPIIETENFWSGFRLEFPGYEASDFSRLTGWVWRETTAGRLAKRPI